MSFKDCLNENLSKALTPKQTQDLLKEYDALVDRYTKTMGDPNAADMAAQSFIVNKQQKIIDDNFATIRHAVFQKRITDDIKDKLTKRQAEYDAMPKRQQLVERKPSIHHIIGDMYQEVHTRTQTVARTETLKLVDFYNEHGSKMLGLSQKSEQIPNVIKAMLGEKVPNKMAGQFGKQISDVFDSLHTRFKNAGGSIGKITNYFPQTHNPVKLKNSTFDEWSAHILPRLDRKNMIDYNTGLPMDDKALMRQMTEDYEAITTNGISELAKRVDEGYLTSGRGSDVFKRKQQSRFYQFKDADSFLEYNEKFGVGREGLFDAVGSHIHSMARDIALMEKMGSKPNAMSRYMDTIMQSENVGQNGRNFVNGMYNLASGKLSDYGTLALPYRIVEGTKALTRFFLGGAVISAMPDAMFVRTALKTKGFKQTQAMQKYFNGLNPSSPVTQRSLQRFTTVMSGLKGQTLEGARFTDSLGYDGGKVVQGIGFTSSMILRASGLTRLTDQGKMVTMSGVMGEFAENSISQTPYSKLNTDLQKTLQAFNITPDDYEVIIRAKPHEVEDLGGSFLTGEDILRIKDIKKEELIRISSNYDDMVTRMGEIAVNEPTLRTRAITTGAAIAPDNAKIGSTTRAVMGALMSFKGFPITVTHNFILPLARGAMSGNRVQVMDAVQVLGFTTVLGAMAYQAKTIMRGEEARDMEDPKFWLAAAMQGGGAGIFGDFLFADYSRFNQSFAETLAGPVIGTYGNALRVINGNYNRALDDGSESKFFADAWKEASKFIPGATLWYARLPLERALLDGITSTLDPNFDKKINSREKKMMRDENRGYWWRPNSGLSGAID